MIDGVVELEKRILIVDDEKPIVDILKFNLEKDGYKTLEAYDGEEAVKIALEKKPDLILLDVMLPKIDGLVVCRQIRQHLACPIIMLTAKEEVVDKIIGLELGADDYMTKPFSIREVLARVKANLRKHVIQADVKPEEEESKHIKIKDLILDTEKYLIIKNGLPIDLTVKEFDVLKVLVEAKGQVFSREEILQRAWGYEYLGDIRTVDVTIRRLREKIEDNPSSPKYIITKRGIGYYV